MKKLLLICFIFLSSIAFSQNPCPGLATVSYAGKVYNTVKIGTQCWLKENLDVGNVILVTKLASNNGVIEKYCYNDDLNNCAIYGGLYQWAEALQYYNGATNSSTPNPPITGFVQGICPSGWHIPNNTEFAALAASAGNDGNNLKAIGQGRGSGAGTNTTGFSAMLAGFRIPTNGGSYFRLDGSAIFWSVNEYNALNGNYLEVFDIYPDVYHTTYGSSKEGAVSVRCINNDQFLAVEDDKNDLPKEFHLYQNYPNPFNPSTRISFYLPQSAQVALIIYNAAGQEIAQLIKQELSAGRHEAHFNGSNLSSGIYIGKLTAGNYSESIKLVLLK